MEIEIENCVILSIIKYNDSQKYLNIFLFFVEILMNNLLFLIKFYEYIKNNEYILFSLKYYFKELKSMFIFQIHIFVFLNTMNDTK